MGRTWPVARPLDASAAAKGDSPAMNRVYLAFLAGLVMLSGLGVPLPIEAGSAVRVVVLADLTVRAEEVGISSKHLTLIHFEMGDVSMVAVGDPTIVSVTVRGPDVLLKATASSGTTNAFIWQASRYTQWILVVRHDVKDPRLIVVKEAGPGGREESLRASDHPDPDGAKVMGAQAGAPPAEGLSVGVGALSGAVIPEGPTQTSPAKASAGVSPPQATGDTCGKVEMLDQFVKTLSIRQRELFGAFLADPTLARLQALLLELNAPQRCGLLALLSAPGSPPRDAAGGGTLPGTGTAPSATDGGGSHPGERRLVSSQPATDTSAMTPSVANPPDQSVLSQVAMTIAPRVIDGQIFFYYTLENHGRVTLLTDVLRLRILDRDGHRLAFGINRASPSGRVGRLQTNDVEYGVIALGSPESGHVLEWKLGTFGSAAQYRLRLELPA